MTNRWQYQIRIYVGDEFAEVARRNPDDPAIASITEVLTTPFSQSGAGH